MANLPAPTFDLDTWSSNYTGPLKPLRLAHAAAHCPPLSQQALTLALDSAKLGKDVQLYTRLCDLAAQLGMRSLSAKDTEWIARQEDANRRELARLEQELKGYKNNLIRESIRMGQEELATHQLMTGGPAAQPTPDGEQPPAQNVGLNAAYAAYGRMRDYCTTPTHIAAMTLRLILTSVLQAVTAQQSGSSATGHFNAMQANSNRLRSSGVKDEEMAKLLPIASASSGLASLGTAAYKDAANAFISTPFDLTTIGVVHNLNFTTAVASANDIAIYGGLTALATLSRQDLTDRVLGGPFRAFLELEPHMRKAISLYTTAKYRACLDTLQRYSSDWNLDLFLGSGLNTALGSQVDRLFALIREKSIVAYFSSFSQVSLSSLSQTFTTQESELLSLIERGALDARLDLVNGLLVAPREEVRGKTHGDAKEVADEVERTLLLRLHRVNVGLAGLEVPAGGSKKGGTDWEGKGMGIRGY